MNYCIKCGRCCSKHVRCRHCGEEFCERCITEHQAVCERRPQADPRDAELSSLRKQVADLTAELDGYRTELQRLRRRAGEIAEARDRYREDLNRATDERDALRGKLDGLVTEGLAVANSEWCARDIYDFFRKIRAIAAATAPAAAPHPPAEEPQP